jgi:hypothetical protein
LRDLEDQRLAIARSGGKLNSPLAKHINTARPLAFHKQHGAGGIGGGKFDFFEGFQRSFGQSAEKIFGAQLTDHAILNQFETVR